MSCANPFFTRLAALSEVGQVRFLERLPDDTLRAIERACAPPDCDCDILAPCPEHGREGCECPDREIVPCAHMGQETPLYRAALIYLRYRLHPDAYFLSDALPEPEPSRCMIPEAKAAVMAERAAAGKRLWSDRDYLSRKRFDRAARGMGLDIDDQLGLERVIATKETNPDAPANGHAVPGVVKRRGKCPAKP